VYGSENQNTAFPDVFEASEMQLWLHSAAILDESVLSGIVEALSSYSICAGPANTWPPAGDGIIVFSSVDDELLKLFRSVCCSEDRRILAIAASPASEFSPWPLLQAGAADVLSWRGPGTAHEIASRLRRWEQINRHLSSPLVQQNMIGRSPSWLRALRQVIEAALYSSEPILINGESGTGKELAARLIHALDSRKPKREIVVVDCTNLIPDLAGSELFGHQRGAFTGAVSARAGAFQLAHEGTLFLDEIGDLSLPLQAQLLRVIQEKTYKPVGGNNWQKADFRLVAATNRDLRQMTDEGAFRRDLYYRIASIPISLPPLDQRREDIVLLARHFAQSMQRSASPEAALDPSLETHLMTRDYPGNVRDLRQLIARIMHRHCGTTLISPAALPEQERPREGLNQIRWPDEAFLGSIRRALLYGYGLNEIAREAKEAALAAAFDLEEGSVRRAAERLGVTERAIQLRRAKGAAAGISQSSTEPA
jgi:transcriptional regulator with GAF, ATPase, and Fis domain